MVSRSVLSFLLAFLALLQPAYSVKPAFVPSRVTSSKETVQAKMSAEEKAPCASQGIDLSAHPSTLPGDPSLILTTNVDLGDKKMDIMKGEK